MKKIIISLLLLSLITVPSITKVNAAVFNIDDYSLVIYTYESLLNDPGYDFVSAYAAFRGISADDINVVYMEDANGILAKAILEKDNPAADVLIGLDNVLIFDAKKEGILESYDSPTLVNISSDLILNLDPEKYLLPYDYGIIALWYDLKRINISTNPELEFLKLEDILTYNLDKKLVVEDPTLSSPGLGFLLWTIAIYGDPKINFEGVLGENWRDWWKVAKKDLRITSSWGDAFSIYYTPEENRPIMVSYGTSPAYDVCHPEYGVGEGNPPPSAAVVSYENPTPLPYERQNAWFQIEGIGLVKNAPHDTEAKKFIDWFLSKQLQDNIPLNNWMYPANTKADIPSCFANHSINPENFLSDSTNVILNDILTPNMIQENLDMWLDDWESEFASFSSFLLIVFTLFTSAVTFVVIKKHRQHRRD